MGGMSLYLLSALYLFQSRTVPSSGVGMLSCNKIMNTINAAEFGY